MDLTIHVDQFKFKIETYIYSNKENYRKRVILNSIVFFIIDEFLTISLFKDYFTRFDKNRTKIEKFGDNSWVESRISIT